MTAVSNFRLRAAALATPLIIALAVPSAASAITINKDFKPQNEFKLDPWVSIHLGPFDLSINKAVFMLLLAAVATVVSMLYVARKMEQRPNRIQTVVEAAYDLTYTQITLGNIESPKMVKRYFGFIATLFFFLWFSNILGYLPLPLNTEHTFSLFGLNLPSFQLYAATANLAIPLALALVVWITYHYEGIREHGPIGYVKSWVPAGVEGVVRIPVFLIEALSQILRLISLSARLFANMLAGHMLILIMGGGMIVLLGSVFVAPTVIIGTVFYLLEVVLIASLQAFIFATLSAIYIGGAVAQEH